MHRGSGLWVVRATVAAIVLSATAAAADTPLAPAPELAENWCELDAPGLFRQLRQEARDAGRSEVGPCPPWEPPEDLPEYLTIPLPCGRAMAFARVDVPASGVLDHLQARFGGAPANGPIVARLSQGARQGTLAGAFSRRSGAGNPARPGLAVGYDELAARSYYIATHELTELQRQLIGSEALAIWARAGPRPPADAADAACAKIAQTAAELRFSTVQPAGNLSWYDAQALLGALNDYVIHEGARRIAEGRSPLVPWEQGSTGFLRLPTELEWEYAAMGGAIGLTTGGVFPPVTRSGQIIGEPALEEIAVVADTRRSEIIQPVGSRLPNLLGLYDTVGNVGEMTQDLFTLVRPDMPHGTAGGIVLRGGNALTPPALLSPKHRQELPLHTAEGAGRTPFSGARLAIAAPVLARGTDPTGNRAPDRPNIDLERRLELETERLIEIRETPGASFRNEAQTLLNELRIRIEAAEPGLARQMAAVSLALEQSEAAINAAREAEIHAEVRSVADSIFAMRSLSAMAITWHERLDEAEKLTEQLSQAADREARRAQITAARSRVYRRTALIDVQVREIEGRLQRLLLADADLVADAVAEVSATLRGAGIDLYDEWVWPRLERALARLRASPGSDHFAWLRDEFDEFRRPRIQTWGQ